MRMENPDMVATEFGFAIRSEKPPHRGEYSLWFTNTGQVYQWDGDGWTRLKPPEPHFLPAIEIPHG